MFGTFFFILMGLYTFYYIGMVGYDLYAADKMVNAESEVQIVDVSAAASSYVPKDVRSMIEGGNKIKEKPAEPVTDENGGGRGQFINNEYQEGTSPMELKDMYAQAAKTPSLFAAIHMSI